MESGRLHLCLYKMYVSLVMLLNVNTRARATDGWIVFFVVDCVSCGVLFVCLFVCLRLWVCCAIVMHVHTAQRTMHRTPFVHLCTCACMRSMLGLMQHKLVTDVASELLRCTPKIPNMLSLSVSQYATILGFYSSIVNSARMPIRVYMLCFAKGPPATTHRFRSYNIRYNSEGSIFRYSIVYQSM